MAVACSKTVTTSGSRTGGTGTTQSGKYSEDLSSLRPRINPDDTVVTTAATGEQDGVTAKKYVEAKYAVNQSLDAVLDSIARINYSIGFIDGFTIQVYSGVKREEALNAKKTLSTKLPEIESQVQFMQPNYRVRAGQYYDRFDAQRDYVAIKKFFPNAILIPERIALK